MGGPQSKRELGQEPGVEFVMATAAATKENKMELARVLFKYKNHLGCMKGSVSQQWLRRAQQHTAGVGLRSSI